ncbi:MAG: hypothetical protein QXF35_04490 [Candidatus Bilamarchaeaceae archaeon]
MLQIKSHAHNETLLKAAQEVLENQKVLSLLANSEELPDYFFNGFMAFNILSDKKKKNKKPEKPQIDYGKRIAAVAKRLGISYLMLNSDYRSDMKDGGASYIANYIKQIRQTNPNVIIESVLKPSFNKKFVGIILNSVVDVISYDINMDKNSKSSVKKVVELIKETRKFNKNIPIRIVLTINNKTKLIDIVSAMRALRKAGSDLVVVKADEKCECSEHVFEVCQREGYMLGYKQVISKPKVKIAYDFPEFISTIY